MNTRSALKHTLNNMKANHSINLQENKQRKRFGLLPDDRRTGIAFTFKDCYYAGGYPIKG